MKRKQFVKSISKKINKTQSEVYSFLKALEETMTEAFKDRLAVRLNSVGVFRPVDRKQRNYKNPKTKQIGTVTARKSVAFRPSKVLKRELNK